MLAEKRFELILQELSDARTASVMRLCELTGASEATIRRDLTALAKQGRLNKVHGGAVLAASEFQGEEPDVPTKTQLFQFEKAAIAKYAAGLISHDDVIYLDAGTTTMRMIDYLGGCKATFVTNGIACAHRMLEMGLRAYIIGGYLKPGTWIRQGFTTPDPEEAAIKAKAAEQSYLTYVLADSSKFEKVSAVTVLPLEKATIITERLPDPDYLEQTVIKEVSH